MELRQLSDTGLYLVDPSQPQTATWGVMLYGNQRPERVNLGTSFNNADSYYAFFPAADRGAGWSGFADSIAAQMKNVSNRRFGFFNADGSGIGFLSVTGSGNSQTLNGGQNFTFRNILLRIMQPSNQRVAVTYEEANTTFRIQNLIVGSQVTVAWLPSPAGGTAREIIPTSDLIIPLAGPTPGVMRTDLSLDLADQAAFETGPMYFGPAQNGDNLLALRYPTFLSGGSGDKLGVTAFADPAQHLDPERTYFELTDEKLVSGFITTLGRQISLTPRDGMQDPQKVSTRFVLADRPVTATGQEQAYYLTPMGALTLSQNGVAPAGEILCGYSATEVFTFGTGDVLHFWPLQPAFMVNQAATVKNPALYLGPDAKTSWVSLSSDASQNTYFSQPQSSPIYENDGQTGSGTTNDAYKLKFKPIAAWPALGSDAPLQASPLFPLVPYGGLSGVSETDAAPFQSLESKAINPARRQVLSNANPARSFVPMSVAADNNGAGNLTPNMTPLGLVGGFDANSVWRETSFAISGKQTKRMLQFQNMGDAIRSAFYQNQIFMVIDQDTADTTSLFSFDAADATVELADWFFDLRLKGADPAGVPPIIILKFFRDKSIKELVQDQSIWEAAPTFSSAPATRQQDILKIIAEAEAAVEKEGRSSIYHNFVQVVNDPQFTGLLALNTALDLQDLPAVIKALLGGMVRDDENGQTVSNVDAFRAHHLGVSISDTGADETVTLDSSSIFALVDYEDEGASTTSLQTRSDAGLARDLDVLDSIYPCGQNGLTCYGFKVIYLRALFENNALASFDAEVDLSVNNLFAVGVNQEGAATEGAAKDNIVKINGSYSEHDGAQTYSFLAKKTYEFTFDNNTYLKKITFDKVQFSATEEESGDSTTSTISSRFAIWGSMEFNELEFLDMFSFEKLSFADLGIEMSYQLVLDPGAPPKTQDLTMNFAPGNLRFDFGATKQRTTNDSMLALLPFKLKSFLYSEKGQDISDLDYFGVSLNSLGQVDTSPTFNFALIFDLDLGSLGGLVGDLSAFKFSMILGWQPPSGPNPNALVFGIQMPEADGKLELTIEGVLKISIKEFQLKYVTSSTDKLLVLSMHDSYMEILGTRIPPGNIFFDLALFAPTKGENKIGWIAALNAQDPKEKAQAISMDGPMEALEAASRAQVTDVLERQFGDAAPVALAQDKKSGDEGSNLIKLDYLGVGQRVGPDAKLDNFDAFLAYMRKDFWAAIKAGDYDKVYKPDGGWIIVSNVVLLDIVGLGFVFYDATPFYSLKIYITKGSIKGLSFEITYTKVSDDVGLFFINFTLPDTLRTFQAGAASVTLPSLKLSIYTNSDFKIDLGFPANDDWSVCFRVEAFAGPVPVTGSGGFYIAKLSSATDNTFVQKDYDTILAAGFGARMGVGKNFVSGPLKAGVSLTFFGIIEGAIGYYAYNSDQEDVIDWLTNPKALALKGQFGVIGEIYGSIDFAIIKASVNVRIQASVGMQLLLEAGAGGDLLLYVEASLTVSVSVRINLGLFKITISFSFRASFRFEWQLISQGTSAHVQALAMRSNLAALAAAPWNPAFGLQTGLNPKLSSLMTPEFTTVWADASAVGDPWFAVSLTMEYLADPSTATLETLKPFETMTAQMLAWALNGALGLENWEGVITQDQINGLNQHPDLLVGGLTYDALLAGLGQMFTLDIVSLPADDGSVADAEKENKYATVFPMPPFLSLATAGRDTDLSYVFSSKSNVSQNWIDTTLQTYFSELYTNTATNGAGNQAMEQVADTSVPLTQMMFVDWFHAVIRASLNGMLTQMQNDDTQSGKLSDIYLASVKSGEIRNVAGQMAQYFRSGLRLPRTDGMELPAGSLQPTNALYALIWQEFPVGSVMDYTVSLGGDAAQNWVTVDAKWDITEAHVAPYKVSGASLPMPSVPQVINVLQSGAQAFALANPITWTPAGGAAQSLRLFSASMLSAIKTSAPLAMSLSSRQTAKAYDADTTPFPTADTSFALAVEMTVRRVPAGDGVFLGTTYALGAADLTQQTAMRELLAALMAGQVQAENVKLLYQASASESGLVSDPAAAQLFVLRTNTTTQSVPPATVEALALTAPEAVSVGANADDPKGFLQILEQASVTNQTGYYLTFETADGSSLPDALFGSQNFAQVTFLFELDLAANGAVYIVPEYANALVLQNAQDDLLYYAETTDPKDETTYVSTAAGALGFEMTRAEPTGETVLDQLANLYSLVAYQVPESTGYRASGLSVPSGPQKRDETDLTQSWRLFVPLYKLATDNTPFAEDPNRYASIGETVSIQSMLVDAYGNAFGGPTTVVEDHANLFFDDLLPLGNWSGVRSIFDFLAWDDPTDNTVCAAIDSATGLGTVGKPQKGMLSVYLCPSKDALPAPNSQSALATAEMYRTIHDQLSATGPNGTATTQMFVSTNLDSSDSDIALNAVQTQAVMAMILAIESYLTGASGDLPGATLSVQVPSATDLLPLVFEIQVSFGIKRLDYVSPDVAAYPNAFRVTTNVPAQSDPEALQQLASDFSKAFGGFTLATGPADAGSVIVPSQAPLATLADEEGDNAKAAAQPKGLWAVSTRATDFQISKTRRAYLAPKPLDTKLRSGTVMMPNNLPGLGGLSTSRVYSDIDLDQLARSTFAAIDNILGAENASNAFAQAPDAYRAIAVARENIADSYADNEIQWLLDDVAYQGRGSDLCQGQNLMAEQMRAALGSAYAVNTIVQTDVTFAQGLPAVMGNRLQLFGQMRRPGDQPSPAANSGGFGLGTARVDVPAGQGGQNATTSFLYGVTDQKIEEDTYEEFPLEWAVSHLQVFLEDRTIDYCTHSEQAPPSIWLQFINAFTVAPLMGDTVIPLAFREYPTPPSMMGQQAEAEKIDNPKSLAELTNWTYTSTYQARLLSRDEITLNLIYNTGGSGGPIVNANLALGEPVYTLFEALTRFQAGYAVLQSQLSPVPASGAADALTSFAALVTQLANNSDWKPTGLEEMVGTGPMFTLEQDVVKDVLDPSATVPGQRKITLTPDPLVSEENPWVGVKSVTALDPTTLKPYAGQTQTVGEKLVKTVYAPPAPLTANFVTHQVQVSKLTTLAYENANSGIGTRRNAQLYPGGTVFSNRAFIYQTPIVALINPIIPFVQNDTIFQIYPNVLNMKNQDLGLYIQRLLEEMMGIASGLDPLPALAQDGPASTLQYRRLKLDVRYGFPIGGPSGSSGQASNFVPLTPVMLVRSFDLPVNGLQEAIDAWVGLSNGGGTDATLPFAAAIANWFASQGIALGQPDMPNSPPSGAFLAFDITLFSQLDQGTHQQPLLRLSDLRLELGAVKAP